MSWGGRFPITNLWELRLSWNQLLHVCNHPIAWVKNAFTDMVDFTRRGQPNPEFRSEICQYVQDPYKEHGWTFRYQYHFSQHDRRFCHSRISPYHRGPSLDHYHERLVLHVLGLRLISQFQESFKESWYLWGNTGFSFQATPKLWPIKGLHSAVVTQHQHCYDLLWGARNFFVPPIFCHLTTDSGGDVWRTLPWQ